MGEIGGTVIHLDIFRCSVSILVGPDNNTIIKGLPKMYKQWGCSEGTLKDDLEKIKKVLEEDEDGLYKGTTLTIGVDALIIFMNDNISQVTGGVAVHEFYHAVRSICNSHGVNDEETEAYMLEYLCNEFWRVQEEWKEKWKKKKKKK